MPEAGQLRVTLSPAKALTLPSLGDGLIDGGLSTSTLARGGGEK